ncbi:MAG TPA: phosphodiester glycosidase family protein, partial [Acidimicrobiales bacterium]|nr:phosphodiester glycosidase family protein [Acidimicrobiales bacterium]
MAVADPPFDWAEEDAHPSPNGVPRTDHAGSGGHIPRHRQARKRLPGSKRAWSLIIVGLVAVLLSPSAWSYGQALAAPGNTALTVRSVDWLRDHHFRWLVNDVENFWYNHHKPKKGGTPTGKLAQTFDHGAGTATGSAPSSSRNTNAGSSISAQPKHLPAPAPIQPIATPPIAGEGQWHPLGQAVQGVPAMYAAYLRPDPVYTSLVTGVAWVDPTLVRAVLYGGVQEPGGSGWQYQGSVAPADRPSLLAAFNSGFKLGDSKGGYYAEGRMVQQLKPGVATLLIRADGTPTVGELGRDFQMGPDVAFARQNLSLIVDNGQPAPDLNVNSPKWGATLGNKVHVWRSAVGVTADGALLFAGGNNLTIVTLAGVMARAGAVRAMELDINPGWVHFNTFGPPAAGQPPSVPSVAYLVPGMGEPINRYVGSPNSR